MKCTNGLYKYTSECSRYINIHCNNYSIFAEIITSISPVKLKSLITRDINSSKLLDNTDME